MAKYIPRLFAGGVVSSICSRHLLEPQKIVFRDEKNANNDTKTFHLVKNHNYIICTKLEYVVDDWIKDYCEYRYALFWRRVDLYHQDLNGDVNKIPERNLIIYYREKFLHKN